MATKLPMLLVLKYTCVGQFSKMTKTYINPLRASPCDLLHPRARSARGLGEVFFFYFDKTVDRLCRWLKALQVFLRPAHYTLGTLLRPKSQKKHELGCFEHLEFIPRPFSVPPVHFVWASALSKNRKIEKKKKSENFFHKCF